MQRGGYPAPIRTSGMGRQELSPGRTHHTDGWSKGWMLTQPSVCASSRALLLASSHTWRGGWGGMGAQRGRIQPWCPRDRSLVTVGLGDTRNPRGAEVGVPGVTLPQCRGAGDAGGGPFRAGVCHAQPPGAFAQQPELRISPLWCVFPPPPSPQTPILGAAAALPGQRPPPPPPAPPVCAPWWGRWYWGPRR